MFIVYAVISAHQTGDDVACGAHGRTDYLYSGIRDSTTGPSDGYWIVPGTEEQARC